jgi:hypothetical protein
MPDLTEVAPAAAQLPEVDQLPETAPTAVPVVQGGAASSAMGSSAPLPPAPPHKVRRPSLVCAAAAAGQATTTVASSLQCGRPESQPPPPPRLACPSQHNASPSLPPVPTQLEEDLQVSGWSKVNDMLVRSGFTPIRVDPATAMPTSSAVSDSLVEVLYQVRCFPVAWPPLGYHNPQRL